METGRLRKWANYCNQNLTQHIGNMEIFIIKCLVTKMQITLWHDKM